MTSNFVRRSILAVALAATLWATWDLARRDGASQSQPDGQAPTIRSVPVQPLIPSDWSAANRSLELPKRANPGTPIRDLFERPAPVKPSSPISAPVAVPPPVLRYAYVGKLADGAITRYFLSDGEGSQVVTGPVELAEGWKLQAVTDRHLEFIHQPSGHRHVLPIDAP